MKLSNNTIKTEKYKIEKYFFNKDRIKREKYFYFVFKNKNLNIETIKLLNISYKYPSNKFKSLDNISFEINKNEILGVIGTSGSGKSTFIRCINRL